MYSIIIYEKFEAIFKKVSNTSMHYELPLIGKATITLIYKYFLKKIIYLQNKPITPTS